MVQSFFKPSLINKSSSSINNKAIPHIRITRGHQLRILIESRFYVRTYRIKKNSLNLEYYYCRYKYSKGVIRRDEIRRNRTSCVDYGVPLCDRCFGIYHNRGNYSTLASGFL